MGTDELKDKKILVAGATGFLGQRVVKRLEDNGLNYGGASLSLGTDFRNLNQTKSLFEKEKPNLVINCAVFGSGGVKYVNDHAIQALYDNVLISAHLLESSRLFGVERFINPISNCTYPDVLDKDFKEEEWWNGSLHPSVLAYGMSRKYTWVQAWAYNRQYVLPVINLILPNMYGPGDHFEEDRSHALGALITKFVKAKENNLSEVMVWGTGKPVREWLFVDDAVEAVIRSLAIESFIDPVNVGADYGVSVKELAELVKAAVGYEGQLVFDTSKPDGAPYKVMSSKKCREIFNWVPPTALKEGIATTVRWYYQNVFKK